MAGCDQGQDGQLSVNLSLGTSGRHIASIKVCPDDAIASFRRAAFAAAGADPTLLASFGDSRGAHVFLKERMLAEGDSVRTAGLNDGDEVSIVFIDALDNWLENDLKWRQIDVPLRTNFDGPNAVPVGRDRILVYGQNCFSDDSDPIIITAHDIWLVGCDEASADWACNDLGDQFGASFLGRRQVPLPLPAFTPMLWSCFRDGVFAALFAVADGEKHDAQDQTKAHNDESHDAQGGPESKKGVVRRFRLLHATDADMGAACFVEEGDSEMFDYKFDHSDYYPYANSEARFTEQVFGKAPASPLSCGDLICGSEATVRRDNFSAEELAFYDGRDDCPPSSCNSLRYFYVKCKDSDEKLATFRAWGAGDISVLGRNLCLMGSKYVGEDEPIMGYMRLVEWQTGKIMKKVCLPEYPNDFQWEEFYGILPGSSQSFCHVCAKNRCDWDTEGGIVTFCSPVPRSA